MNYEAIIAAKKAMEVLNESEKLYVINMLLQAEEISLKTVIVAEANRLEDFRLKSRNDIRKLATAGLDLGEKQIKLIPKMKNDNKRNLFAAFTKTLLSTRVYYDTPFEKNILATIDFSGIDEEWYQECWALESVKKQGE